MLADPSFRDVAVKLASLIGAQGGASQAADLLERLLRHHGPPSEGRLGDAVREMRERGGRTRA
jgi:hypothetical protein